jgi:hypothetical protein
MKQMTTTEGNWRHPPPGNLFCQVNFGPSQSFDPLRRFIPIKGDGRHLLAKKFHDNRFGVNRAVISITRR